MTDKLYLLTPAGRMVQGDCFAGSDKDHSTGRQKTTQAGDPKMQWYIGLAIRKDDPTFPEFWGQVTAKAALDFPNGASAQPTFAWKYIDGDLPEHAGKEGFAGHYVLRLSTGWQPSVIDTAFQQIVDPAQVKRGCYLQVSVSVQGNGEPPNGKPGIYINPLQIMLIGYGPEISNAPPPEQTFANRAALPIGASATPLAPAAAGVAPGVPGAAVVAAPGAMPGAVAAAMPGAVAAAPVAAVPAAVAAPAAMPGAMPGAVAPAAVAAPVAAAPAMPGAVAPVAVAAAPAAVAAPAGPPPGYVLGIDPATGQPAYVIDPMPPGVVPAAGFLTPQQ